MKIHQKVEHSCIDCGATRLVGYQYIQHLKRGLTTGRCLSCAKKGKRNTQWIGGPKERVCKNCKDNFSVYENSANANLYCSVTCALSSADRREVQRKNGLGKYGSSSHNWRGGKTKLSQTIRGLDQYKTWRSAVFVRDNFTCVECGVRGNKINADHIEAFALLLSKHGIDSVQKALICADLWDLRNGRTLCVPCHRKTETFGKSLTNKV